MLLIFFFSFVILPLFFFYFNFFRFYTFRSKVTPITVIKSSTHFSGKIYCDISLQWSSIQYKDWSSVSFTFELHRIWCTACKSLKIYWINFSWIYIYNYCNGPNGKLFTLVFSLCGKVSQGVSFVILYLNYFMHYHLQVYGRAFMAKVAAAFNI